MYIFIKKISLGAILFFSLILFQSCGVSVKAGEIGLLWRPLSLGEALQKDPLANGFHWLLPWNDIILYSVQLNSYIEKVDVLTQDQLRIDVSAAIILRPVQVEIFSLQKEVGPEYYKKLVRPEFRTCIRNVLSKFPMVQIADKSPNISKEILVALTDRIKGKHIEIFDVIIDDVEYSKPILEAIERKLAKQQELEQMKYELSIAEKNIELNKQKAHADAEAAIIRAEGQAKAQEIISNKLTTKYLQYKAFENGASKFFYVPTDRSNLPIIVNPDGK